MEWPILPMAKATGSLGQESGEAEKVPGALDMFQVDRY